MHTRPSFPYIRALSQDFVNTLRAPHEPDMPQPCRTPEKRNIELVSDGTERKRCAPREACAGTSRSHSRTARSSGAEDANTRFFFHAQRAARANEAARLSSNASNAIACIFSALNVRRIR